MDESLVILDKDAKHRCQRGNNGARNFGRGFAKILRRSKKTRWLRIRTGLSQSHASGPGEKLIHTPSIINSREFASWKAVVNAKAKQLRMNDYGKRRNRAQPYNSAEELRVKFVQWPVKWHQWSRSYQCKLHKLVRAFRIFKAAKTTTTLTYRALKLCVSRSTKEKWRNAYGSTITQSTKTRACGLTAKHLKTPQEMRARDRGRRNTVRLFEKFLKRRPL